MLLSPEPEPIIEPMDGMGMGMGMELMEGMDAAAEEL